MCKMKLCSLGVQKSYHLVLNLCKLPAGSMIVTSETLKVAQYNQFTFINFLQVLALYVSVNKFYIKRTKRFENGELGL